MIFTIYVLALFLIGPLEYFVPEVGQIHWVVTILSAILLLRVFYSIATRTSQQGLGSVPGYMVFMGLFLVVAVLSSAGNMYWTEALLDAKNYFQFWSIPFALWFLISGESLSLRMMKGLLVLAFINTFLCMVQYSLRSSFPGDLVTGTFGGVIGGTGGPNAALSAFQIVQAGTIIQLALRRQLSWPRAIVLIVWFLIPVGLTHAKATLVFLLIMTGFTLGREALRRPVVSALVVILMIGLFSGLFYFEYRDANKYEEGADSVGDFITNTIEHNIESKRGDLTRLTAVTFWLKENPPEKSFPVFLLGHGIGASKFTGVFQGHVSLSPRYRDLNVGIYTLTRLLWDVGIVGTVMFIFIFVSAFRLASKLKDDPGFSPMEASFLASSQVACFFFILDIPYQDSHLAVQAYAAFVMITLGCIAVCKKKLILLVVKPQTIRCPRSLVG